MVAECGDGGTWELRRQGLKLEYENCVVFEIDL